MGPFRQAQPNGKDPNICGLDLVTCAQGRGPIKIAQVAGAPGSRVDIFQIKRAMRIRSGSQDAMHRSHFLGYEKISILDGNGPINKLFAGIHRKGQVWAIRRTAAHDAVQEYLNVIDLIPG